MAPLSKSYRDIFDVLYIYYQEPTVATNKIASKLKAVSVTSQDNNAWSLPPAWNSDGSRVTSKETSLVRVAGHPAVLSSLCSSEWLKQILRHNQPEEHEIHLPCNEKQLEKKKKHRHAKEKGQMNGMEEKIRGSRYYKQTFTQFSKPCTQQDLKRWQLGREEKAQLYNQLEEICQSQQDAKKRNRDLLRDFHRVERELSLLATKADSFRRKRDIYKKALQKCHYMKVPSRSETFHKSHISKEDHFYTKQFKDSSAEGYDELSESPQVAASLVYTKHDNFNKGFIACPHAQVLLKGCCNHSAVPICCCFMNSFLSGQFGNQTPERLNAGGSSVDAIPQTAKCIMKGSAEYRESLAIACHQQSTDDKHCGGITKDSSSCHKCEDYIQCTCKKKTFYRKEDCTSSHERKEQEPAYQQDMVATAEQLCLEEYRVELQLAESECPQKPSTSSSMSNSTSEQAAPLSHPAKDIHHKKGTLPVTMRHQAIHRPENSILYTNSSEEEMYQQDTLEYALTECYDAKYKMEIKKLPASLIMKTENADDGCDENQILEFADKDISHGKAGSNSAFEVQIESEHHENKRCFCVKGSKNHMVMEPFVDKLKSSQQNDNESEEEIETRGSGQDSNVSMATNGTPTVSIQNRKLRNCVDFEDISDHSVTDGNSSSQDEKIQMQDKRCSELEGDDKVKSKNLKQIICSNPSNEAGKKVDLMKTRAVEKEHEDLSEESENEESIVLKEQYRQTDMNTNGNSLVKQRKIKTEEIVKAQEKIYGEENGTSSEDMEDDGAEISDIEAGNIMAVGEEEDEDRSSNGSEGVEDELDEDVEETSGEVNLSSEGEDDGFVIIMDGSPKRKSSKQASKDRHSDPSETQTENGENSDEDGHEEGIVGEMSDTEESSEEEESLYVCQGLDDDFETSEEKKPGFCGSKDDKSLSKVKKKNECLHETEDSQAHDMGLKIRKEEFTNPQKSDLIAVISQETLEQMDTEKERKSGTLLKRFSEDCSLDVIQMGPHESGSLLPPQEAFTDPNPSSAETQPVAETPSEELSEEASQSENESKKQEWSDSEDDIHSFFD